MLLAHVAYRTLSPRHSHSLLHPLRVPGHRNFQEKFMDTFFCCKINTHVNLLILPDASLIKLYELRMKSNHPESSVRFHGADIGASEWNHGRYKVLIRLAPGSLPLGKRIGKTCTYFIIGTIGYEGSCGNSFQSEWSQRTTGPDPTVVPSYWRAWSETKQGITGSTSAPADVRCCAGHKWRKLARQNFCTPRLTYDFNFSLGFSSKDQSVTSLWGAGHAQGKAKQMPWAKPCSYMYAAFHSLAVDGPWTFVTVIVALSFGREDEWRIEVPTGWLIRQGWS